MLRSTTIRLHFGLKFSGVCSCRQETHIQRLDGFLSSKLGFTDLCLMLFFFLFHLVGWILLPKLLPRWLCIPLWYVGQIVPTCKLSYNGSSSTLRVLWFFPWFGFLRIIVVCLIAIIYFLSFWLLLHVACLSNLVTVCEQWLFVLLIRHISGFMDSCFCRYWSDPSLINCTHFLVIDLGHQLFVAIYYNIIQTLYNLNLITTLTLIPAKTFNPTKSLFVD